MSISANSYSSSCDQLLNEEGQDIGILITPQSFKKLTSNWLSILLMFLYSVYLVVFIPFQLYCHSAKCVYSAYSALNYSNIILFFITFITTSIIYCELRKFKRRGYESLYKEASCLVKVPLVVFSISMTFMLAYVWILIGLGVQMAANGESEGKEYMRSKSTYTFFIGFQLIVVVEVLLSLFSLFFLTVKLLKFNSSKNLPDILDDELEGRMEEEAFNASGDVGSREAMVIEMQQGRIDFFKSRCRLLVRGLRHVIKNLPPDLQHTSEKSLQQFLDEYEDDKDGEEMDIGQPSINDDFLISA